MRKERIAATAHHLCPERPEVRPRRQSHIASGMSLLSGHSGSPRIVQFTEHTLNRRVILVYEVRLDELDLIDARRFSRVQTSDEG